MRYLLVAYEEIMHLSDLADLTWAGVKMLVYRSPVIVQNTHR